MPSFTRKNGTKVLISANAFETVVKAIKAEPGLTTFDYEAKTLVPVTTINHILECTAEGHRLVKAGKVAYEKRPGRAPAWASIKGAQLTAPTVKASMSLRFQNAAPTGQDITTDAVRSDFNTQLELANEAMLRPSMSPKRRAARRDAIVEVAHSQAIREDATTGALGALRVEIETLKDYTKVLKETIDLRQQLALMSPTA